MKQITNNSDAEINGFVYGKTPYYIPARGRLVDVPDEAAKALITTYPFLSETEQKTEEKPQEITEVTEVTEVTEKIVEEKTETETETDQKVLNTNVKGRLKKNKDK